MQLLRKRRLQLRARSKSSKARFVTMNKRRRKRRKHKTLNVTMQSKLSSLNQRLTIISKMKSKKKLRLSLRRGQRLMTPKKTTMTL